MKPICGFTSKESTDTNAARLLMRFPELVAELESEKAAIIDTLKKVEVTASKRATAARDLELGLLSVAEFVDTFWKA